MRTCRAYGQVRRFCAGLVLILITAPSCDRQEPDEDDSQHPEVPHLNYSDGVEIVTWNLKQFPRHGSDAKQHIKRILEGLGADLYCLQEVADTNALQALVGTMEDYDAHLSEHSYQLHLGLVYRPETISVRQVEELWPATDFHSDEDSSYYNNARYFFASRPPLRIDLTWSDQDRSLDFTLINIHLKCCGDGRIDDDQADPEFRRQVASSLLKDYLGEQLASKKVVIVGDWNDAIEEPETTNVFWNFRADSVNYRFVDLEIARGSPGYWSWPGWESSYPPIHFDHILINAALFDEEQGPDSEVQTLLAENYLAGGSQEYRAQVSDHRPVAWVFKP